MRKNKKYLLENLNFEIPISFWVMYLDNFLGEEKAEEFYEYLINARDIKRLNDIRNLIDTIGFSIYDLSHNEQLAFISIFKPFDTTSKLVTNMKNCVNEILNFYQRKNLQLLKEIKKLGYSCEHTTFNWKDKKIKDTYQREYTYVIFGEEDDKFLDNIIKLAKKYKIEEVLITDNMKDKSTKMQISSNIIDVNTGKIKVVHNIPYEKNKKIINKDVNYLNMKNYYSKQKQEKVKNKNPYSFNSAMLRNALLNRFKKEDYND